MTRHTNLVYKWVILGQLRVGVAADDDFPLGARLARLPCPVPHHLGADGALGAVVYLHVELGS